MNNKIQLASGRIGQYRNDIQTISYDEKTELFETHIERTDGTQVRHKRRRVQAVNDALSWSESVQNEFFDNLKNI